VYAHKMKALTDSIEKAIRNGDIAALIPHLEEALRLNPNNTDYLYNLGVCYSKKNNFLEARRVFLKALSLNPKDVSVLAALAKLELEAKQLDSALNYIAQALLLEPENIEVLQIYASILLHHGDMENSLSLYKKALSLDPNNAVTLSLLGSYFAYTGDLVSAKNSLFRSFELNTEDINTLMNLSEISLKEGKYFEAIEWFEKILDLYPDATFVHEHIAVIYLGLFEFAKGWREYDFREVHRLNAGSSKELPKDLSGKRILIRHEQGLGDEIFFLRFLPELKNRGAWIAYMPRPKLYNLLKRSDYIDQLVQEEDELLNIHYSFFVGDLPRLLDVNTTEAIPEPLPLYVSQSEIASLSEELASYKKPLIGLTWRAGVQKLGYLSKEIRLAELIPYLKTLNATIVILQRNLLEDELALLKEAFGNDLIDASSYNDDLEKMVPLLAVLDTHIAVSNTNVHLAGSLGKKCHTLIPFPAEWRWGFHNHPISPWYRTFSLYRQHSFQSDWREVYAELIDNVRRELTQPEPSSHLAIINESIAKIQELIAYEMYDDAQRLCEMILTVDASNLPVRIHLAAVFNATQQYEKLLAVVDEIRQLQQFNVD